MSKQKIDRAFVSEHDIFLNKFDKNNPEKSASQLKEINKHKRIFALRDGDGKEKGASILKRLFRVFYR